MITFTTEYGTEYTVAYFKIDRYSDTGNLCIAMYDENCEPITRITVNTGNRLPDGYSFVKDYAENEGISDFLLENEIAFPTFSYVDNGFVQFFVWKFDMERIEEINNDFFNSLEE